MRSRILLNGTLCLLAALTWSRAAGIAQAEDRAPPPEIDAIYGYAHFYSASERGPVHFCVHFENCGTVDSRRTLTRAICNFCDCPVYLDCSGGWPELGATHNVKDVSFLVHLSNPKIFGLQAAGFKSGGYVFYELDLERQTIWGGNPHFADFHEATILFEFSDGTWVEVPFDQPSEWGPWGAKTDFYELVPVPLPKDR